jgi:hypothetical protein
VVEQEKDAGVKSKFLRFIDSFLSLLPRIPHTRAAGVSFYFKPRSLQRGFNTVFIERFVALYAAWTPATYRSLGYHDATTERIKYHISKIHCDVVEGYISAGPNKTNVLGLTHTDTHIEIGVLDSMRYNGNIRVSASALAYQLHNACVWRFAGLDVVQGRGERDLLVIGLADEQLKAHRSALEASFMAVYNEARG